MKSEACQIVLTGEFHPEERNKLELINAENEEMLTKIKKNLGE